MDGRIYRPEQGSGILELPEIGRLHIGMKNERGLPQSIDWFRPYKTAGGYKWKYAL